ncbi:hypothetical protein D3C77_538660 [compost metagenome]
MGIDKMQPQMRRSRVVRAVSQVELNVDERNKHGQRRRSSSLYEQRYTLTRRVTALDQFHQQLPHSTTRHEHEGHGPLRAWTAEAVLSNQWFRRFMNIYDIAPSLT